MNLRGNLGNQTTWIGQYVRGNDFQQTRWGYEYNADFSWGQIVPSVQLASKGFVGTSVNLQIGGPTYLITGLGRTNLKEYYNLPASQYHLVQAKKRWRVLEPGDWGLSSTLGRLQHHGQTPLESVNDIYLNVPVTWSMGHDRFAHLNVGWIKHQVQGYGAITWGLALEQPINKHVIGILETYGEVKQSTKYQLGLRIWVVPQRVQIDTTLGNVWGSSSNPGQRWVSIGLRLLSPPLY